MNENFVTDAAKRLADDVAYVWNVRGSIDGPYWRTPEGDIVDDVNGRRWPGAERIPDTDMTETIRWFKTRYVGIGREVVR